MDPPGFPAATVAELAPDMDYNAQIELVNTLLTRH